jgi:hypothetical protein
MCPEMSIWYSRREIRLNAILGEPDQSIGMTVATTVKRAVPTITCRGGGVMAGPESSRQ